jgi:hypothetical protein
MRLNDFTRALPLVFALSVGVGAAAQIGYDRYAHLGGRSYSPLNVTDVSVCRSLETRLQAKEGSIQEAHESCLQAASSTRPRVDVTDSGRSCVKADCEGLHSGLDDFRKFARNEISTCMARLASYERTRATEVSKENILSSSPRSRCSSAVRQSYGGHPQCPYHHRRRGVAIFECRSVPVNGRCEEQCTFVSCRRDG